MQIAVMLDHYFLPIRQAAAAASAAGYEGVQVYTTAGELAPENLSRSGQKDFLKLLSRHGLTLSALCADLGGPRFADAAGLQERIERTCRIIEQAARMKVPVVTAHIGTISKSADDPTRRLIYEAVDAVGAAADRAGVLFGIETGQEHPALLVELLGAFSNAALGINYDPANLLTNGFDPAEAIESLADDIVYVHAKDAIGGRGRIGREVPLGQGQIDWPQIRSMLSAAGYTGWYTVEYRHTQNPVPDLAAACQYLKNLRGQT